MTSVKCEFHWSEEEYLRFCWSSWRGWKLARLIASQFATALFVVYLTKFRPGSLDSKEESLQLLFLVLAITALLLVANLGWCYRTYRSAFQKDVKGTPLHYEFSEGGANLTSHDAQSKLKWHFFTKWVETGWMFQLHFSDNAVGVPFRVLSSTQLDELRALFEKHIGPCGVIRSAKKTSDETIPRLD